MRDKSAPDGYEWKDVELRIGARVYPNRWREFVYMGTAGMDLARGKALVPVGEPVVKRIDFDMVNRI